MTEFCLEAPSNLFYIARGLFSIVATLRIHYVDEEEEGGVRDIGVLVLFWKFIAYDRGWIRMYGRIG